MNWREVQRKNFTKWQELSDFLELGEEQRKPILKSCRFPLNIPFRLAQKIEKKNLNDPILLQFLPLKEEEKFTPSFLNDPVGDSDSRLKPKLLHKYSNRALLLTTSACAMNCRFCFRRNFEYEVVKGFEEELEAIRNDESLSEIILSGGDPLSLTNRELGFLFSALEAIPHVKRIRIHSRFIIGIPERIDDGLVDILKKCSKQIWFVMHCNHPNELDETIFTSIKKIQLLGIPVLNQAALLRNVNDSYEVLRNLCELLANHAITFYYLHQFDRVQGASHFEVDEQKGINLIKKLTHSLSGYAIPKYVKEIKGYPSKYSVIVESTQNCSV